MIFRFWDTPSIFLGPIGIARRRRSPITACTTAWRWRRPPRVASALVQSSEELGICCIFLNQLKIKPGVVYGDPTTTNGGDAPKFYASVRVQLGTTLITAGKGDEKKLLGQEIGCRRERCALRSTASATSRLWINRRPANLL